MFEFLNRRFSISCRIGLLAAFGAVPIALLLFLFVSQVCKDIRLTQHELRGTAYLAAIWPRVAATASDPQGPSGAKLDPNSARTFQAEAAASAFAAASDGSKVADGVALIQEVADGSNLTLDPDLDTFYAARAVTVDLPRLLAASAAVSAASDVQDRAIALRQMRGYAASATRSVNIAIAHDATGHVRQATASWVAALNTVAGDMGQRAITAPGALGQADRLALQGPIDGAWKAECAELTRLLQIRLAGLQTALAVNLGMIALIVGVAARLTIGTIRELTKRLARLVQTLDRLNAKDTSVEIPFLTETTEIGRVAATLDAYRLGLIEVAEERRRADTAMEAVACSEARYRMLAETISDIVLRYDVNGIIEYISPSIRQLGYEPERAIGRNIADVAALDHPNPVMKALREGRPLPTGAANELSVRRADGGIVWMQGSPSLIHDDAGNVIGVLTSLRDITERRTVEEELRRKQAEAEEAANAKAQFLANMSHEIRTPLTGVVGFAGLLERMEGLPPEAQAYAQNIATGGQALLSLVNDILDFSRIESGEAPLHPQPVDLMAFLRSTVEMIRPEAARKGLALSIDPCPDLPRVVCIDADRVRQVMLNLVGNAIKFTQQGGIHIEVGHLPAGGGLLRIAVTDTGVGISPDQVGRLFQRFSQIDESNTRQYGGAGLGLAISKGLVERHGGEIWVESEMGKGSTFCFTVAARVADQAPSPARDEEERLDIRPMRILVVDDAQVNRKLLAALLSPFDLELHEAADGVQAVEAAQHTPFDLILMDLQMPRMDGLAAAREIRAHSAHNRQTPILALSANVLPAHIDSCHSAGMNDHIGKPIDPRDLLAKIDRWTTVADAGGRAAFGSPG